MKFHCMKFHRWISAQVYVQSVRDPDRSHAKPKDRSVAPAPRSLHHSGGAMVASGAGSSLGKLSEVLRSELLRALATTPLQGPRWHEHSVAGQQGNELPMLQLDLSGIRVHRDNWWFLLPRAAGEGGMAARCASILKNDDIWQLAMLPDCRGSYEPSRSGRIFASGSLPDRASSYEPLVYDRAPSGARKTGQAGRFISVGLDSYFSAWSDDPATIFPIPSAGPLLAFLIFASLGAPTWLMTNGDFCPIVKFLAPGETRGPNAPRDCV